MSDILIGILIGVVGTVFIIAVILGIINRLLREDENESIKAK